MRSKTDLIRGCITFSLIHIAELSGIDATGEQYRRVTKKISDPKRDLKLRETQINPERAYTPPTQLDDSGTPPTLTNWNEEQHQNQVTPHL
jgi:hypothetical protein